MNISINELRMRMIMKTLHTIYTSFAKRLALTLILLLTLGVTTAWAAVYTYDCTSNKNFYTDAGLTTNPSTGNSNTFAENASFYAEDGACFTVLRASKVYFNSGYLMVGNYQPVLQLPTYANEKITKVKFWNSSGCSTSVKVTIKSGSNTAAAQQTWSTKGSSYTYNISETYQSSTLKLDVTSANAQITKIEITTSASCANSIAVSAGTKTNVNSISFSPNSIATCSSTAADRQVTITVTPNTGYEMTSGSRLTFTKTSGTATATYVSGPTTNGSSYQFVYRFNQDDNGGGTFSASCTAKKTTVSFDQNGGEGGQAATVTATYDQPMPTLITLPTSYSHNFIGYFDAEQGGTMYYEADGTSAKNWDKIDANYTLYAQWEEKSRTNFRTLCTYDITYTETYDVNHENPNTYTVKDLPLTFKEPTTEREGYTFIGWNPESLDLNTRGDQEVEAQWQVNQYTVTWKLNGGQWQGGGTDDRVNNHNYGEEVTRPVDPSRTGYTFTGWSPAEIPATMPAENLKFTAQWTPTPYTITWKLGGIEYATSTVSIENPLSTAPENPSDGELGCCADKFMGWSSQQSPSAGDIFTKDNIPSNVTTAKIYYAVFATTAQGVGTSIADFSEMGYENGTAVTAPIVLGDGEGHGDATITLAKAQSSSNAPTYYTDGEAVRIYAGGTITIASSYHIKNVAFTFAAGDGSNEITANSGTYADGVWTENVESPTNNLIITIGGEAGQHRRIASITVTTGVSGSQYTNYVTQCTTLPNPALSGGSVPAIAVNCGDFSTLSNSQAIVFSTMQDLTCPVTFEVIDGDFLISTAKDRAAQYQSKITVTPTKSGENIGKLKNVYVRANATNHNENFTGSLKVTSNEITEAVIIDLTSTVICDNFTLTTVDHLGNETVFGTYFAGDVIATEPTPSSDACSENYTFAGWSESAVEYGSLVYNQVTFPYTMPAEDVTLYPVYQCNKTADYHRVTSDLGANNWAGDYVMAAYSTIVADGRTSALQQIDVTKVDVNLDDNTVPASFGDSYYISLVAIDGGYVLKARGENYVYITNAGSASNATTTDVSTAGKYPLSVSYQSNNNIVIANPSSASDKTIQYYASSNCFGFYKAGIPVYLYKKSPLYTSSLICGTMEASDAVVTSTAGQKIKVNVPITLTSSLSGTYDVTAESNNSNFTITNLSGIEAGEHTLSVHYTPTATTDGTETANITLTATNGATTTFQVTGRHLPETFAIVAKVGNMWYALPEVGYSSNKHATAYPVEVDNASDPTEVTSAIANNAAWSLRQVYQSSSSGDRYAAHGTNVVLKNNQDPAMALNASASSSYLLTGAQFGNYHNSDHASRYEWTLSTSDLETYTLTNAERTDKQISISKNAVFGLHASDVVSKEVRFLPITDTYAAIDIQVVEWYADKVLIRSNSAITAVTAVINDTEYTATIASKDNALYEISNIPFAANPAQVVTLNFTVGAETLTKIIAAPVILSRANVSTTDALFTNITKEVYNYTDLVLRDGSVLTVNGTEKENTFNNVNIYPTAKIVVPEGKKLSLHSLTFIGGISEVYNGSSYELNKYAVPELSLKGTLGKTVTTIDYVMRVNLDQMYQMGVPFDVDLNNITYWDGTEIKLGDALYVSAYDGQARANRDKKTWVYETDFESKFGEAKLKAGVGYTISAEPQTNGDKYAILRLPMKSNISSGSTEAEKSINVVAYDNEKGVTITANHKGWNYLSNPYMTSVSGGEADTKLVLGYLKETGTGPWEWVETTQRYVTIPHDNGQDYYQMQFSDAVLKPFKSFFVQIATEGDLSFALASRQNAPARYMEVQTEQEIEFEILLGNEKQSDNTGLLIAEQFSPAYEINADLEKMTGSMSVYTIYGGHKLAYNALSPINASEWIPMGYIAPAAGEYTYKVDKADQVMEQVQHVYLIDYDNNSITDLINNEYKFYTSKGKNETRFAINVVMQVDKDNTTTGVDMLLNDHNAPIKFIHQDKMYIQNGGTIYDATGKQVTNINK